MENKYKINQIFMTTENETIQIKTILNPYIYYLVIHNITKSSYTNRRYALEIEDLVNRKKWKQLNGLQVAQLIITNGK